MVDRFLPPVKPRSVPTAALLPPAPGPVAAAATTDHAVEVAAPPSVPLVPSAPLLRVKAEETRFELTRPKSVERQRWETIFREQMESMMQSEQQPEGGGGRPAEERSRKLKYSSRPGLLLHRTTSD